MAFKARLVARDPKGPQERQGSKVRRGQLDLTDQMVEMATLERLEMMVSQ